MIAHGGSSGILLTSYTSKKRLPHHGLFQIYRGRALNISMHLPGRCCRSRSTRTGGSGGRRDRRRTTSRPSFTTIKTLWACRRCNPTWRCARPFIITYYYTFPSLKKWAFPATHDGCALKFYNLTTRHFSLVRQQQGASEPGLREDRISQLQ